jgi:hypothetical protein
MNKTVYITDSQSLGSHIITSEGYLIADVDFARIGVQNYMNAELGMILPNAPANAVFGLYRSEEEVFNKDSMSSFELIPLTEQHPDEFLDSDSAKYHMVGTTGQNARRHGEMLCNTIKVIDRNVVDAIIKGGKNQFSAGYNSRIVYKPGVYKGAKYHFVQENIRGNHLAVALDNARCGNKCSLKDSNSMANIAESLTVTVSLSDSDKEFLAGVEASIKDAEEKLIESSVKLADAETKLAETEAKLADAEAKAAKIQTDWDSCKQVKDAEIATIQASLDAANVKIADTSLIEKMVDERVKTIVDCISIMPDIDRKLSDSEMKKAVVIAKCPDLKDSIDEKSAEYINARFDVLLTTNIVDAFQVKPDENQKSDLVDSQAVRQKRIDGK